MIDKIAMITLLILYILATLTALFIYLIIRGGSESKSEKEEILENEEEMNYWRDYKNKKDKNNKKVKRTGR